MHLSRFLLICFVVCVTCWLSFSQITGDTMQKNLITHEYITMPNFGRVNAIVRDDRGFLWFGTTKGVCKYDGYGVTVLTFGTDPNEEQQSVTAILKTDDKRLILGTGMGVWTLDLKTEKLELFLQKRELSQTRITSLVQDSSKTVWIGTATLGLFSYVPAIRKFERYTAADGLTDDRISCLLVDRSGRLWIGTAGSGLNVLDTSRRHFAYYQKSTGNATALWSDQITSLCEGKDEELWIGTNEGLNIFNVREGRMQRVELPSPIPHRISSMVRDPSDNMWVAASELGLLVRSDGKFSLHEASGDAAGSFSSIKVLYLDPLATSVANLHFWIGTRYGVTKMIMAKNPFNNHDRNRHSLRLNRGAVLSLCGDRSGILWLGLWGGGLNGLRRGADGEYHRVHNFEADSSNALALPNGDVRALLEDTDGNLWVGTSGGLAVLDGIREKFVNYKHVEGDSTSLVGNVITRIYEDRTGTIWICTTDGLSQLIRGARKAPTFRKDSHRFKNYFHRRGDSHPIGRNYISDISEDEFGNIWVSTYGRGMNRLSNGTITRFVHREDSIGTKENFIYSFVEDNKKTFWLSTAVGLVSFNPFSGVFSRQSIAQLDAVHIFGIVPDQNGSLWLSTGVGLAKFNPTTGTFVRYDGNRGIPFREFFSDFFTSAEGKLFVGGLDGFTEFFPESLSAISLPPEIVITNVRVFDKEISRSFLSEGRIQLSHDQNFCSFSFAALDYANPAQNRFAYKMDGIDNDWIDAGTHTYASYTNLDPGTYVFRVKGCNSENVWNEAGTSVTIVITPPYWQTWWFKILAAVILLGTLYAAYRYRLTRVLELERLRLRIADDLHDDIGSNLSTIAMVSRAIQRAPDLNQATKRKLAEIYDIAISTSEGMKDIVWFIKPENDTLDDLLLRMKDTASSLLGDIDHSFQAPKDGGSLSVSIDSKKNFFLGFKETLTNIVKHASATKVDIRIKHQDGMIEMVISDNGRGFDQRTVRRGNGFNSLLNRARNIHGKCEINSRPGKGTTVMFSGRL